MSRRDIGTDDPRVRVRPGKGTRPRTKKRPSFDSSHPGFVTEVDRGRFTVVIPEGTSVMAVKARALGRKGVIVGDRVRLEGDLSGKPGILARIVTVEERRSVLRRSFDEGDGGREKQIVANATQMLVVVSAANPAPKRGMLDRALVAALHTGIKPLVAVTKTDLDAAGDLVEDYRRIGITVFTLRRDCYTPDSSALARLKAVLDGEVTVLLGHSGVGKSTLFNALVPQAQRATGHVNATTGKGRHTSSSAVAYPLGSGWVIDTPGLRSFGLAHLSAAQILAGFAELSEIAAGCPRGCTHRVDSPDCDLDAHPEVATRLASFRKLLGEVTKPY